MLNEPHDLSHEFPEYKDAIHKLKTANHHFARLFEEYNHAARTVHRFEQGIETPADTVVEDMKKKCLHLKDELFKMLREHG